MKPSQAAYLAAYGFRTLLLRQHRPLIAGMPLTDVCNLQCPHCVVANTGRGHYPLPRIEQALRGFYDMGVRIMYLQGGEIMMWRDGPRDVNDVVRLAHDIGFFKVAVVTNGTMGIPGGPDLVWVSMDGTERVHDSIRGPGVFAAVIEHLQKTTHPRVYLNMTINRINADEVEGVAELASRMQTVRGVSFNFHTPYRGVEELCLDLDQRARVIDLILDLKRKGMPVLNTAGGLKALQKNTWRRPVRMIRLMEMDQIYECCFGCEQPGVCERCGYAVIAELSRVLSFDIPTILQSISLFK